MADIDEGAEAHLHRWLDTFPLLCISCGLCDRSGRCPRRLRKYLEGFPTPADGLGTVEGATMRAGAVPARRRDNTQAGADAGARKKRIPARKSCQGAARLPGPGPWE